ncbi:hypothetical protein LTR70_004694 [Exophiala xenobiotica]|nr:hypothetical protein LTR70_004694 [Exophiala xenobiotica]
MPRRKNATTGTKSQKAPTRRSARRAAAQEQDVPDIYQDMLVEAYHNNPDDFAPNPRPAKRRKVEQEAAVEPETSGPSEIEPTTTLTLSPPQGQSRSPISVPVPPQQVVFNNDVSDSEDNSDLEFEDVEIGRQSSVEAGNTTDDQAEPRTLQIELSTSTTTPRSLIRRRKPVSKAERDFRLDVHKWHLLTLLVHVATRNKWCDDERVQRTLKPLVHRKTISNLHLSETRTQAERKYAFERAIEEVCQIWRATWKVTCRGMRRAVWKEAIDMAKEVEDAEDPVDFEDFKDAAEQCFGSRDVGAQFFCALLRSVAVETRLVCSLQVLPFSRVAKGETPQKASPTYITAGNQDYGTSRPIAASRRKKKQKVVVDSPYPIWWVEVFSPAITQWIPLDPIVRDTINKPRTGFEPPASDNLNSMSYVIAFEEDGTAKDVTRRYASMYNGKTRKTRVESTKGGQKWYERVTHVFGKMVPETKDAIENAELARRVQMEGMPKNVQDFKDHPVYVLERHLRNNEVIYPQRESGKFTVGSGKNQKVESVYRREDVHACRSADGWYRRGRDVKVGEQPLKRVVPRKKRSASVQFEEEDDEAEREGVTLYAEFQTDVYVPPPVVSGRVPRNGYGNLDVYVQSMIPAGGVHIRHPLAAQATKVLGIDAAEAVTGFKFKGRQGTAIVDGVVIDARFTAAVLTTTASLEDELEGKVNAQRTDVMLNVWKKMHAVLRVRQKVHEEYGQTTRGNGVTDNDDESEADPSYDGDPTYEDDADAGGFVADVVGEATKASKAEEAANLNLLKERAPIVLPPLIVRQQAVVVRSSHKLVEHATDDDNPDDLFGPDSEGAGGTMADGAAAVEEGGGFMIEDEPYDNERGGGFVPEDDDTGGGGFLPEDADQAGGFVPEEATGGGFVQGPDGPKSTAEALEDSSRPHRLENGSQSPTQGRRTSASNVFEEAGGFVVQEQQTNRYLTPPTQASNDTYPMNKDKQKEAEEHSISENSILSEDPEDIDADPQWIEDAFDDDI